MRDDSKPLLSREGFLAYLVPALVELAPVLGDEVFWGMQRGVIRTEGQVGKERPAGIGLLLISDAGDGLVHQVLGEVLTRTRGGLDEAVVADQQRGPLVGLAAEKAVELFKAHPQRPAIERPGGGVRGVGREVPLAEGHGVVAVLLQHLSDGGGALGDAAVVAREAGSRLRDGRQADGVLVASGEQGTARRRAHGGGVEVVVAQPGCRQFVQVRRTSGPP